MSRHQPLFPIRYSLFPIHSFQNSSACPSSIALTISAASAAGDPRLLFERGAVEPVDDADRGGQRALDAPHQELHDMRLDLDLAVGEQLCDDAGEQEVVGLADLDRRRRLQPRRQVGKRHAPGRRESAAPSAADASRRRAPRWQHETGRSRRDPAVGVVDEERGARGSAATTAARCGAGRSPTAPDISRQIGARCDLPEPAGPASTTSGDGQSGQRSIRATAAALASQTTRWSRERPSEWLRSSGSCRGLSASGIALARPSRPPARLFDDHDGGSSAWPL